MEELQRNVEQEKLPEIPVLWSVEDGYHVLRVAMLNGEGGDIVKSAKGGIDAIFGAEGIMTFLADNPQYRLDVSDVEDEEA